MKIYPKLDELRQQYDCVIDVESTYDSMIYVHDQDCYAEEVKKLEEWIKKIDSDVEVVRCHHLLSDGTWHDPMVNIYLTEDPVGLLWISDDTPSWDDRDEWEETLIEWMGAIHPVRVMNTLIEYLEDHPDYEMEIQGLKIRPDREYIIVDLNCDLNNYDCYRPPNCLNFEILEVISEEFDYHDDRRHESYYSVIAHNSDGEEVKIIKTISQYQDSPDYTARIAEE